MGNYLSSLRIFYFKVPELEPGQYSSQTFKIPFTLPGKVILDAFSKSTSLIPGVSNEAKIEIKNKGYCRNLQCYSFCYGCDGK